MYKYSIIKIGGIKMSEQELYDLCDKYIEKVIEQDMERGSEMPITRVASVAFTLPRVYSVNLGITEGSPEDIELTNYVNSKLDEYDKTKTNTPKSI